MHDNILGFRTLLTTNSKKDHLASQTGHQMLASIEHDVDNLFLRKELVRFSLSCTGAKCNDSKDAFPWVSRCMLAKI